jgi:lipid-binding SYLF domain-containing protein
MIKNCCLSLLCIALAMPVLAQDNQRLKDASGVLKEVLNSKTGIPQTTLDNAICVVVFPNVKKIGAAVGVTYGRGVLACRAGLQADSAWSAPAMYSLDAGSIGPQFGGSSTDCVVLVMTEPAAEKILSGKWKLGADAGAYLGSSGATTQGLTGGSRGAQVVMYARANGGVFAGASIGNASITSDDKANRELYGRPITATEIVRDSKVTVPDVAQPFMAALPQTTKSN